MKRCKSCDFFEADPVHESASVTGWGDCNNEKAFHDGSADWDEGTPASALFQYHDSEGYGAGFEVHEKFGCIAHKSRWIRRLFSRSRKKVEAKSSYDELEEVKPTAADLAKIKRAQALLKDWSEKNVAAAEREEATQKENLKKT